MPKRLGTALDPQPRARITAPETTSLKKVKMQMIKLKLSAKKVKSTGKTFHLFCSLLYPKHLEQHMQ